MGSAGQMMGRQRAAIALVFALVLGGLVFVGHATTAPPDVAVSIVDFSFIGPSGTGSFTIPVGTKVTWTNNGNSTHSSTSTASPTPVWDSPNLTHGQTFSFTFTSPGSFPYKCRFHPLSMFGTITVIQPPTLTGISLSQGGTGGNIPVTITGTDFLNGATATFGGVAATNVTFVDANTIVVTTPPHGAGTVDVVVTNPDGGIGTLAGSFTYIAPNVAPVLRPVGPAIASPPDVIPPLRPSVVPAGSPNLLPTRR